MPDPLTGARLTLLGTAEPADQPALRARFIARHPAAAGYAAFRDFSLMRIRPERGHLVAGFGRIHWLEASALQFGGPEPRALIEAEAAILAHMNQDHAEAVSLYATTLLGRPAGRWRLTGIDAEGIDLRPETGACARLDFEHAIATPEEARATLVALARRARSGNAAASGA